MRPVTMIMNNQKTGQPFCCYGTDHCLFVYYWIQVVDLDFPPIAAWAYFEILQFNNNSTNIVAGWHPKGFKKIKT